MNAGHAQETVRIVTKEFPPYNFTRQGKITGRATEVVEAVLKEMNVTGPKANYQKLKVGRIDLWVANRQVAAHIAREAGDDPAKTLWPAYRFTNLGEQAPQAGGAGGAKAIARGLAISLPCRTTCTVDSA